MSCRKSNKLNDTSASESGSLEFLPQPFNDKVLQHTSHTKHLCCWRFQLHSAIIKPSAMTERRPSWPKIQTSQSQFPVLLIRPSRPDLDNNINLIHLFLSTIKESHTTQNGTMPQLFTQALH